MQHTRPVLAVVEPELKRDFDWLIMAHQLLRQHGRSCAATQNRNTLTARYDPVARSARPGNVIHVGRAAVLGCQRFTKEGCTMNDSITLTIGPSERAELEALLNRWQQEFALGKEEHERTMARIERHSAASRKYLDLIRANLEQPCGKA